MFAHLPREVPPTAGLPVPFGKVLGAIAGGSQSNTSNDLNFRKALAAFLGAEEVDIFSSGTTCLWLAFVALKRRTGRSKVILPGFTCPLVAIAAHAAGMQIVLCDTMPDSFEFDLDLLSSLCDQSVAAVVLTDIGGLPAELESINAIAHKVDAFVIEDAAQAFGASRHGKGLLERSSADLTVFSLAAGKGLSLFDGGIIIAKDLDLRNAIRITAKEIIPVEKSLQSRAQFSFLGYSLVYNPYGLRWVYVTELRDHLKRGDLEGAVGDRFDLSLPHYDFSSDWRLKVGLDLLPSMPDFLRQNRQRALVRMAFLRNETGASVLSENPDCIGSWPFLSLLCRDGTQRDAILNELWTEGLGVTRLFIHELAGYDYLKEILPATNTPNARFFAERNLTISNSHWLRDDEFSLIVNVVREHCAPHTVKAVL